MKNRLLTLIVLACITTACYGQNEKDITSFDWLVGTWKNTRNGVLESWHYSDDKTHLLGMSYKVVQQDTAIMETITLKREGDTFFYLPDVPHNQQPISFKITSFNTSGFISENPQHDFPKKIAYELTDKKKLKAVISGDGKEIPFYFEKVD
ncbi:MAG: DUF6265 family protein [Bacteroidota bacterium]